MGTFDYTDLQHATTVTSTAPRKKRRAKNGERRMLNYDVIVYAPENWLHRNRITVRDKETGRVVEEKGYIVSWAVGRAVRRLILESRRATVGVVITSSWIPGDANPFTLTDGAIITGANLHV